MTAARHVVVTGSGRARPFVDSESTLDALPLVEIDAHRRLRGPYTAAGGIVRTLFAGGIDRELVAAHEIEVLTVAPELRGTVPATRETLTSLAVPKERTRFYSHQRTARISHGLVELIRDHLTSTTGERQILVIDNIDHCDPTDREFVTIALRRLDPAAVTLVVGSTAGLDELDTRYPSLAKSLREYATPHEADPASEPADDAPPAERAARYVAGDCTAEGTALQAAYLRLPEVERRRLHDERAAELERLGEPSLKLGAIAYHHEHGSDPAGRGATALQEALDYCIDTGFYDATVDLGIRGRALLDWAARPDLYWVFTTKMTTSLAALGRPAEAEQLYDEARSLDTSPMLHLQAAYATAMLYTRHHEPEMKDHHRALGWINEAIAIASMIADPDDRAFQTVFNENGKALVEAHLGNSEEALRLVTEGLRRLDGQLAETEHLLHRSVLRYNRAQVLVGMRRLDEALAEYDAVIAADPNYPEYHFERAGILRRLDRPAEALAEYDAAIRLSPPFPEFFYNRADLRADMGDIDQALADFTRVLELDPDHLDARVNRAGLLAGIGRSAQARRDVAAGLALAPGDPHLLCVLGALELDEGRADQARAAYDEAVAAAPEMAQALAGRASVSHSTGDATAALTDLDRALELDEDPAVLFNRGLIHEQLGRTEAAAADYTRVLELVPDEPDARAHLAACSR